MAARDAQEEHTMSDNRVMTNEARAREDAAARTAALVGDGSSLTADEFNLLGLAERSHLFTVAPDRYRELQGELDRRLSMTRRDGAR
jgi:hypothetical protein